jgi:hypothetical protein
MSAVMQQQYNYDYAYQVTPIILVGGIAASAQGNMLPILSLLGQSPAFQGQNSTIGGTDDYFARFLPIPGSTLISNTIGTYPFANQQVAANAIIQQPLTISLQMIAPAKNQGDYITKLSIWTSLQNSLVAHNNAGGTYSIATPAFIYTNCLMTAMTDITSGDTKQKQVMYQLDFVQPLITQQQAIQAYNSLMGKLSSGQSVTVPDWSGGQAAAGSPAQGATPGTTNVPASVNSFSTSPGQGFTGVTGSVLQ